MGIEVFGANAVIVKLLKEKFFCSELEGLDANPNDNSCEGLLASSDWVF